MYKILIAKIEYKLILKYYITYTFCVSTFLWLNLKAQN